jgi:hypothetical protein
MNQHCINMYNHNDILIVGDSFAASRSLSYDWPMALLTMLTGSKETPNGVGIGGTSWWTARKYIVKALQNQPPKVLIICHTDALRLPSDRDLGLNSGSVLGQEYNTNWSNLFSREEFNAATMYYTHLMSVDFHEWAREQWFNELNRLVSAVPIVIHLHCFTNYELHNSGVPKEPFIFKHGITSAEVLFHLQVQESALPNGRDMPGARNHFSPESNVKIATALYKAIIGFDPAKNGTMQNLNLLNQDSK